MRLPFANRRWDNLHRMRVALLAVVGLVAAIR